MNPSYVATAIGVSLLIGLFALPVVIRMCHKHNLLDQPTGHKRHKKPTPVLGGVALFLSVWITVGSCVLIFPEMFAEMHRSLIYIFLGAMMIFLVGLSDDMKPLKAWPKLLTQIAVGIVLYMGGLSVNPVTIPFYGSVDIGVFSVVITICWVVGLTNAINIIDGLDGLASGVSLIGAITLALVGGLYELTGALVFAYALIGFLAIFLYYNHYPANIFLGDSGSLQIGYYFAVFSLLVPLKSFTAAALYVPLLALAVPLLEVVMAITRRLATGRNVMSADRRHVFHYLAFAGFSPRRIVLVFYALSVIFGCFALAMFYWNRLLVFGLLALFMVVIFVIFFILMTNLTRMKKG